MEAESLFSRDPRALPLYRAIEAWLRSAFPGVRVDVQRSQITFRADRTLAAAWLPPHPVAGRPEVYVVLTFGLLRRIEHPRIVEAVEPYPGRWTHHVILSDPAQLDDELLAWLREAQGGPGS